MGMPRPYENPLEAQKALLQLQQIVQKAVEESTLVLSAEQKAEVVKNLTNDLMNVKNLAGTQAANQLLAPANLKILAEGYALAAKDKRFGYLAEDKGLMQLMLATPKDLENYPELKRVLRDFKMDWKQKHQEDMVKTEQLLMQMTANFRSQLDGPLMANPILQTMVCDVVEINKETLDFNKKPEVALEETPESDLDKTLRSEFGTTGKSDVFTSIDEVVQVAGVERTEGGRETLAEILEEEQEADLAAAAKEEKMDLEATDAEYEADMEATNKDAEAKKEAAAIAEAAAEENSAEEDLGDALEQVGDMLAGNDEPEPEPAPNPNWPPRPRGPLSHK